MAQTPDRLRAEILPNGLAYVFNYGTQSATCYWNRAGRLELHSGPDSPHYRAAARQAFHLAGASAPEHRMMSAGLHNGRVVVTRAPTAR